MKKRLGIISILVLLFIGFLINWTYSYYKGLEEAYIPIGDVKEIPIIPSEKKVFERAEYALDYLNMPRDENHQRTLETYYDNRAYPGAPPSIPHPVKEKLGMGGNVCLQCHQNGGFVEKFNAYAPVTPHPEMVNCKQCHAEQQTQTLFAANNFYKKSAPEVGNNNALPGSPPAIPHQLQMRENCLSCHAGPAAVKELWVDHPERVNCRQCHVPLKQEIENVELFVRTNTNTQ
ncbi:nitrate reductase cytochrome c-type subunit [Maribacter sp. 2308TA10-17]|uniref:nitrate reductase cytochrome c-type subunit n=1 Tax=Maribacter sp. 2308TA10-17 TaxID=3386276 RepID=UPI0039BD6D14